MGKEKIVVDTNILISALGWEGNPKELFRKFINGEFELIISQKQLEELKRVMDYPKFKFTEQQKSKFLTIINTIATVVEIKGTLHVIKEDPDDNLVLESAIENKASFIITGDKHLLKLKEYSGVNITTVAQFLGEVSSRTVPSVSSSSFFVTIFFVFYSYKSFFL